MVFSWSNLVKTLVDLKGRVPGQYFNPVTGEMEVQQGSGGAANVALTGSKLISAGSGTASTTDQAVATSGFTNISLSNDDTTNNITFAIDAVSVGAVNPIILKPGETFSDDLSGSALHYSCTAGTPAFRYVIR